MSAKQTAASIQNQKFKAKLSSSFQYKKKKHLYLQVYYNGKCGLIGMYNPRFL